MTGFAALPIPGCYEIRFPAHADSRGSFVKTIAASVFAEQGLEADFVETFYTTSAANVLRGMHLQLPPADHAKLVYCVSGAVLDIVLDVRRGSPSYGQWAAIEMSAGLANGVYLPRGVAHGFWVREAPATLMYHVTSEHVPALDAGIAWNSFGAPWPSSAPVISPRDVSLPLLERFESSFLYNGGKR